MLTLPRNVGLAIENTRARRGNNALYNYPSIFNHSKSNTEYKIIADFINEYSLDVYFDVIVNGFEMEPTPEEQVKALYLNNKDHGLRSEASTIRNVLNLLGIKIEGVNA